MSDILQKYSESIDRGSFSGKLFDVGSYPAAIINGEDGGRVYGELYKLTNPDALFHHLDPYEGFDADEPSKSLYLRKKVTVKTEDGNQLTAWTYLYNRPVECLSHIPNGDYLNYLKSKP